MKLGKKGLWIVVAVAAVWWIFLRRPSPGSAPATSGSSSSPPPPAPQAYPVDISGNPVPVTGSNTVVGGGIADTPAFQA